MQFKFLGILMGVAIRTKKPLDLHLAPVVWKQLCCVPLALEDLEEVDLLYVQTLNSILHIEDSGITEGSFHEVRLGQSVSARRGLFCGRLTACPIAVLAAQPRRFKELFVGRVGTSAPLLLLPPRSILCLRNGRAREPSWRGRPGVPRVRHTWFEDREITNYSQMSQRVPFRLSAAISYLDSSFLSLKFFFF